MKLSELNSTAAAETGARLDLKWPDGDGVASAMYLMLKGEDSRTYQELYLEQRRARVEQANLTGLERVDIAQMEDEALERIVACTFAWGGFQGEDGQDLPCTRENVRLVYQNARGLYHQAVVFMRKRANFLPLSAGA